LPSLHLTIAVEVPTTSDILEWCIEKSKARESVRRNLPPNWTRVSAGAVADMLRDVAKDCFMADDVAAFRNAVFGLASTRGDFALPESASPAVPELRASTQVCLRSTTGFRAEREGETCVVEWRGRRIQTETSLLPMFARLEAGNWISVGALADGLDLPAVRAMLVGLWSLGSIVFRTTAPASD
jgi:hypothetical protein